MSDSQSATASVRHTLLPYRGIQVLYVQIALIASAAVLPIIAHSLNAPVRALLPMHWPVILAGMLYGWRAGAITGLLAPLASYLFSGYPMPNILPSMTAELLTYGLISGLLREKFNVNSFFSVGLSIISGRIIFIVMVILTNRASFSDTEYFTAALVPGIVAAILQIATLPFLSQWLVQRYYKDETGE